MRVPVSKYHGCGNDFILVHPADVAGMDLPAFARSVCDRHTGIGADGFIVARTDPLEMEYYNQDGSRADMCGNGIRCFIRFCLDEGLVSGQTFSVQTLAGLYVIRILADGRIAVSMGTPLEDLDRCGLASPVKSEQIAGRTVSAFYMGTIHAVTYADDAFADIRETGRAICEHPRFRKQTNVNFVQVTGPAHMRMQTYERGCGPTLACGTGACASVVQAFRDGKCGPSVDVDLLAGQLHVDVDPDTEQVTLTGPARFVMKGEYEYDETA